MDPERADHLERLRADSGHKLVVVPDTDGELTAVIGDLEELLLSLDSKELLPAALTSRQACDAVGRLGSWFAGWERGPHKVQPVAPDGRFELIPLGIVAVGRKDLERIWAAVARLAGNDSRHPVVQELLDDRARDWCEVTSVDRFERLVALLELDWDDDVDVLYRRLGDGWAPDGRRVVLDASEYGAYQRVTGRILTVWHGDHPFQHFLYRGDTCWPP